MGWPRVQFVSAPNPEADVRFDFNSAGDWPEDETWLLRDDSPWGAPSLSGDPGAYGAEYGYRQLAFSFLLEGTQGEAARQWSALAREIGRRTNWLMVQFSAFSAPAWFRTYRTAPQAISFAEVQDTDDSRSQFWRFTVTLDSDPYGQGERITLGPFTINNDPAAGTNPCSVVLPEIVGDAPAPVRLDLTAGSQQLNNPAPLFAVSPVPDTFTAPVVIGIGGDSFTLGTDTGATVSDAAYSGGSYRPVSFATSEAMLKRITLPVSGIRPGRYSVLLRAARSDTSSTFAFRVGATGDSVAFDPGAASTSSGFAQWTDLGPVTLPAGFTDFSVSSMIATTLDLYASRTSGSGAAYLDSVVLVPVELIEDEVAASLTTSLNYLLGGTNITRFDGDTETVQSLSPTAARAWPTMPVPLRGGFPTVSPGLTNILHLFRCAAGSGQNAPDSITATTTVTLSYAPQWLWLAAQ